MKYITIQDLKKKGASVVRDKGPTYLISNSKVKGVFLPLDEYEMLIEALEDYEDIEIANQRMNEPTIPHDEFWKLVESGNVQD